MTPNQVTVVDYGIGNLFSVRRALEHSGGLVHLAGDADSIATARRLVLPGVGAFADGMNGLRERGLIEPILKFAASGRPLLGICLGMQMLADFSEEFGQHEGLSLIPGHVARIPNIAVDGQAMKVPLIAWSELQRAPEADWEGSILKSIPEGTAVYLVHSYQFLPTHPEHLTATYEYGGHRISAAVRSENVSGFQFHPEKSGPAGLAMLREFLRRDPL